MRHHQKNTPDLCRKGSVEENCVNTPQFTELTIHLAVYDVDKFLLIFLSLESDCKKSNNDKFEVN